MPSRTVLHLSVLSAIAGVFAFSSAADAIPIVNSRGEIARPDGQLTYWTCYTYKNANGDVLFRDAQWNTPVPPGYTLWATTSGTDTHLSIAFNPPPGSVVSGRWYLNYNDTVPPTTATADVTVLMGLKNGTYSSNLGPMTGFPSTNAPQYTGGTFGPGGTSQFPFTQTTMLSASQLATALPTGYDLSEWTGATGIVGMFRMSVPLSQLLPHRFDVGDYNASGTIDASDINLLFAAPGGSATPTTAKYDLNFDGVVNPIAHSPGSDADYWVSLFALTHYGDANLDRTVDFGDLLTLAQNYGSATGGWAQGNFDGTAGVEFGDLLALAQNYGTTSIIDSDIGSPQFQADWRLALSLVPEPISTLTITSSVLVFARRRRA